jgi:selenide,water dikinase
VLVGYRTGDDAGVFRLNDEVTLVQTVDFFTPVVDDPEQYGAIAAGERAVGRLRDGRPSADGALDRRLSRRGLPPEWAAAIVRGGFRKLEEAGCVLLGGHSVRDAEIKFGYAITGLVEADRADDERRRSRR